MVLVRAVRAVPGMQLLASLDLPPLAPIHWLSHDVLLAAFCFGPFSAPAAHPCCYASRADSAEPVMCLLQETRTIWSNNVVEGVWHGPTQLPTVSPPPQQAVMGMPVPKQV